MKKQIDGQISLFDYIAEEEKKRERERQEPVRKTDTAALRIELFEQCADCW